MIYLIKCKLSHLDIFLDFLSHLNIYVLYSKLRVPFIAKILFLTVGHLNSV